MGLLGDFAAGAGAVGAQMSMEALRSTIEKAAASQNAVDPPLPSTIS